MRETNKREEIQLVRARKSKRERSCEGENERVSERHNECVCERDNKNERARVREGPLA